jgi:hypothetical protein
MMSDLKQLKPNDDQTNLKPESTLDQPDKPECPPEHGVSFCGRCGCPNPGLFCPRCGHRLCAHCGEN